MAVYTYPLATSMPVSIAAGADFATETTLALANGHLANLDGISSGALAAAQKTIATAAKILDTASVILGWDTVNSVHKELAVSATGEIKTSITDITNRLSGSLVPVQFDNIAISYAAATANVYTYKLAAATVKTVTVNFTDATKSVMTTVVAS